MLQYSLIVLQVTKVISSCCEVLLKTLNHSTCLQLFRFAESLCLDQLYSLAKRHILYYFKQVCSTESFLELNVKEIVGILLNKYINCATEIDIVDAVYKWYKYDIEEREGCMKCVLDCVVIEDLYAEEWINLSKHELVTQSETAQAWFREKEHGRCYHKKSLNKVGIFARDKYNYFLIDLV